MNSPDSVDLPDASPRIEIQPMRSCTLSGTM